MDLKSKMSDIASSKGSDGSYTIYTPAESTITSRRATPTPRLSHNGKSSPSAPIPGPIYTIRHRELHTVLSLKDGNLSLENESDPYAGHYWRCSEYQGWLVFRETASGKFLGRDGYGGAYRAGDQHQDFGWFVAIGASDAGYHLRSFCPNKSLSWMAVKKDKRTLVNAQCSNEAAVWEFVEAT
ncbi:hypothetical protein F4777DRAFT_446137 [Nemania sp. FL0916]|nr:hypothetical protein F4777DRAFT_446137 [Nemania sp. FL0916]